MKWFKKIIHKLLERFEMKFTLIDFDDVSWEISSAEVHTIILGETSIYVVFKDGGYKLFPNTLNNRNNLPNIRLAQERKYNS